MAQLLLNPGWESGATSWTLTGSAAVYTDGAHSRTGVGYADVPDASSVSQTVATVDGAFYTVGVWVCVDAPMLGALTVECALGDALVWAHRLSFLIPGVWTAISGRLESDGSNLTFTIRAEVGVFHIDDADCSDLVASADGPFYHASDGWTGQSWKGEFWRLCFRCARPRPESDMVQNADERWICSRCGLDEHDRERERAEGEAALRRAVQRDAETPR